MLRSFAKGIPVPGWMTGGEQGAHVDLTFRKQALHFRLMSSYKAFRRAFDMQASLSFYLGVSLVESSVVTKMPYRKPRSEEMASGELCSEEMPYKELRSEEMASGELRSEEMPYGELRSEENALCRAP